MELSFTPAGRLKWRSGGEEECPAAAAGGDALRAVAEGFSESEGAGLFALAAGRFAEGLEPVAAFWREFASRVLAERCRPPEGGDRRLEALPPLTPAAAGEWFLGLPPMQGAEYASPETFARLWAGMDEWIRARAGENEKGMAGFLEAQAPLWHQVGRVCFHLAENKKDPERPFAFLATYIPRLDAHARHRHLPLGNALREYAGERNRKALVHLLSPVQKASEKSALARELVESGDVYHPLAWTPAEAYRFLKDAPLFEESGILVRLPDWWRSRPRPRVAVQIGANAASVLGADQLLDFRVGLALGDQAVSEEEWRRLLAAGDGLVLLKGQWVELDRARLEEALAHWKKVEKEAGREGISFLEGMRLLAGAPADLGEGEGLREAREWAEVHAGPWLKQILAQLRDPASVAGLKPGQGLRTTLRPYQDAGVRWLWLVTRLGLGGCLADDMGLGKTIQVLALLLLMKERGAKASLLVMPASLLANWKSEMERFAPSLRGFFAHPSMRARSECEKGPGKDALGGLDVVLTSYSMARRLPWFKETEWETVILDEAQAVKNPSARQTRAVKELRARSKLALTGTPVENRLSDLWSLFDFLCPGLLGSATRFKAFAKGLEARADDHYAPLRSLVSPYILRRLKTDKRVISDLPEKVEMEAFCGLSPSQAALYQKAVDDLRRDLEGADGIRRRGVVLASLLRFKQICNHPAHFLGTGEFDPAASGKFARLAELVEEISSRQERALVFTQFREMAEPLAGFLATQFGRPGLVMHGGTPVKARRGIVEAFQEDDGPPFFVLSLKVGGTGLNLTAASHVVHFDRWWNPAVENQATDRAFRIGQRRNVLVHKFVCLGTVEERIDEMIKGKTALARDLLDAGAEAMLTEMDDESLVRLVSLDIDRAAL
ncbi:MAG: DEAD/DEAH box helicase [Planctomycetota bacterium]